MPINKSAKFRFEIIDECLRNIKKKWTKAELLRFVNRRLALHQGEEVSVSLSQLRYDLENMQCECGAPIEMYKDGKQFCYRYEDPEFSIKNIPIEQEDLSKLNDAVCLLQQIKGFSVADEMAAIVHRLEQRYNLTPQCERQVISFENTPEMQGVESLEDIYHAIIRKTVLKITYQTFNANTSRIWHVHPYLLKEYSHRWYLLGLCDEKQNISIYALDRMKEIKVARVAFIENEAGNSDDYFKDIIGVTLLPENKVEEIELLFSSHLAPYIQTKPLHKSQNIVKVLDDGRLQIRIRIRINPELLSMLLSYGKDVKVLQPDHLTEKIQQIIIEQLKQYEPI